MKAKRPGDACAMYFEAVNHYALSKPVNHPNEFFCDSMRLRHPDDDKINDNTDEQMINKLLEFRENNFLHLYN